MYEDAKNKRNEETERILAKGLKNSELKSYYLKAQGLYSKSLFTSLSPRERTSLDECLWIIQDFAVLADPIAAAKEKLRSDIGQAARKMTKLDQAAEKDRDQAKKLKTYVEARLYTASLDRLTKLLTEISDGNAGPKERAMITVLTRKIRFRISQMRRMVKARKETDLRPYGQPKMTEVGEKFEEWWDKT